MSVPTAATDVLPTAPTPTYRQIARLAAPMALATVFTLSAVWLTFVIIGHFGGDALYVRSLYLPVSLVLSAVQAGIEISTTVAVARLRDRNSLKFGVVVRSMSVVGLAFMTVATAIVAGSAGPLATILDAQGAGPTFTTFVRLMCLVAIAEVPYLVLAGALRGMGRTGAASIIAMTVMVIQVTGVAIVGGALHLGLASVPCSVAASALAGLALAVAFLRRTGSLAAILRRTGTRLRDGIRPAARIVASVGVPVGGTFIVLALANTATLRVLSQFGTATISGYGIANATQVVLIVPAVGLGTAVAVLVNQNGGATATATVARGAALAGIAYTSVGVLVWIAASPIARIASSDPRVSAVAGTYLHVVGPTLACVGTMLAGLTVLEQTGSAFIALSFNVGYFGLSIGIGAVLADRAGRYQPFIDTLAVANVLALIAVAPLVVHRIRRLTAAGAT
jgi:Na+-driven multidrug efflux pump